MEWNEDCNEELLKLFKDKKIFVMNVMGSPGAGKTSLIVKIIDSLRSKFNIAVIEGDIAGKVDAEKIAALGIPVVQLNTDGACHLEAMSIKNIVSGFDLDNIDVLIIENIGNLVCPAEFNIGEDIKIAILSVPEGDDKVVKYPLMFSTSHSLIINKFDMINYFNFDYDKVCSDTKEMNPDINIFPVSTVSGEGLEDFIMWLGREIKNKIEK
jgi:hydrogenase nickel incorporation protein HypB